MLKSHFKIPPTLPCWGYFLFAIDTFPVIVLQLSVQTGMQMHLHGYAHIQRQNEMANQIFFYDGANSNLATAYQGANHHATWECPAICLSSRFPLCTVSCSSVTVPRTASTRNGSTLMSQGGRPVKSLACPLCQRRNTMVTASRA